MDEGRREKGRCGRWSGFYTVELRQVASHSVSGRGGVGVRFGWLVGWLLGEGKARP